MLQSDLYLASLRNKITVEKNDTFDRKLLFGMMNDEFVVRLLGLVIAHFTWPHFLQ